MNFVLDEQTKLRRRLNAPVAKLLASEMHQEVVRSSFDRYNNERSESAHSLPGPHPQVPTTQRASQKNSELSGLLSCQPS